MKKLLSIIFCFLMLSGVCLAEWDDQTGLTPAQEATLNDASTKANDAVLKTLAPGAQSVTPIADSTGTLVVNDKDGNAILAVDTTNDNVGVGIAPAQPLHVFDAGGAGAIIQFQNSIGSGYIGNDGIGTYLVGIGNNTNYFATVSLADDGYLQISANQPGFGTFIIGNNEEYAIVCWDNDGQVTLLVNSVNVVAADTDNNLCFIDAGTVVRVKNRLNGTKTLKFFANF